MAYTVDTTRHAEVTDRLTRTVVDVVEERFNENYVVERRLSHMIGPIRDKPPPAPF